MKHVNKFQLKGCAVCGAQPGAVTTTCCDYRLSVNTLKAVYKGWIDFKDGRWIPGYTAMYNKLQATGMPHKWIEQFLEDHR